MEPSIPFQISPNSLSYSPRKRSRRRSKDKIRELHVLPIQPTNLHLNEGDLDLHAWGLGDLKKDIQQLSGIVAKCIDAMNETNSLPIIGDQIQKWKTKRIKSQLISSWNVAMSKIIQGEHTFQIWLEAIQTKKRIIRVEALRRVEDLEGLIAFHEFRLDSIDDRMDECKSVVLSLKKQCNILSAMKLFLEEQLIRAPFQIQTTGEENEDETVFKGYSAESGRAINTSDVISARSELSHLSHPKFNQHSRHSSSVSNFDSSSDPNVDIFEKFTLSIELVNRCTNLQEAIRQNQKKEMVNLSITWRCRSMLRHLCEFSSNIKDINLHSELTNINDGSLQGSGIGDLTINRDSRELSGSDSFGDDHPLQYSKYSRKHVLKCSREMISLMEVLTEQEEKSKGYLHKISVYKDELLEIKNQLERFLPANSKWELIGIDSTSVAGEIVMGFYEAIPSQLIDDPNDQKFAPLSQNFPNILESFDPVQDDLFNSLHENSKHEINSQLFVRDLEVSELSDLKEHLETYRLPIDPIQHELREFIKSQSLPPAWVSPMFGKLRSQSVDFDLPDTPYSNEIAASGCGLVGRINAEAVENGMGIENICAVYSCSFLYRNLFCAIAVRDYLEETFDCLFPLYVLNRVEFAEATFILLTPDRIEMIIQSFLKDHVAVTPTYQLDCLPSPFSINLNKFPHLNLKDKLKLFSSLRCSNFSISDIFSSENPSDYFFEGVTLAVNTWNHEAARALVFEATSFLLTNPQLSSQGDPFLTSWKQTEILLAPLENLVNIVSRYDLCSCRQHHQSDLFIPLAAIRILLVAVNKQTYHRFCECSEQLSQWIHLSSIVTVQLFRSAKLSRPSSSSSLCALQEEALNEDPFHKIDIHIRPSPLDDPIPKRVPLAGNVTVSSRTELYHDMLNFLISFLDHTTLRPFQDLNSLRNSIHVFEQTLENTVRLVYALCSLVENLEADATTWSLPYVPFENLSLSKRQYSILYSIRNGIRLKILQYVLGLDERWSAEATIASCRFVKQCLEHHLQITTQRKLSALFRFQGRKSQLYPTPTLNLLALTIPTEILQMNCQLIYSLQEDEAGITALRRCLLDVHQYLLLLIQDSYGYFFGAFLALQDEKNDMIYSTNSFLFRALPDIRRFSLPRSDSEDYSPWFSSSGIHIGPNSTPSSSSSFTYSSSSILFLDPSFSFGHTTVPDPLLSNERLSLGEEFKCRLFEVWAFSAD